MRRWLVGLVAVGVLLAPTSAGALTLRVRHDADDTRSVLDLERVMTGLTHRRAVFGFATFGSFTIDDLGGGGRFQFNLDTKQLDHDDFRLYFIHWLATDELLCRLQTDHGLTIGERPVTFDGTSMSCGIPKWWLDIRERPAFTVEAYDTNRRVDVAPDEGRYRGL